VDPAERAHVVREWVERVRPADFRMEE
jgi:hypothetical protein